jgi:hypothetical protein
MRCPLRRHFPVGEGALWRPGFISPPHFLLRFLRRARRALRTHRHPTRRAVLLGVCYPAPSDEHEGGDEEDHARTLVEFTRDFRSRMQFTYRARRTWPSTPDDSPREAPESFSSDEGWGCAVRSMQMLLAQCLVSLHLGRDWRFDPGVDLAEGCAYRQIADLFLDTPAALLSVERFVAKGAELLGKRPPDWYGPVSSASVAAALMARPAVAVDSVDCEAAFSGSRALEACPSQRALRGVRCLCSTDGDIRRLGLLSPDPEHIEGIRHALATVPQFQGFVGGTSTSAHYVVGTHGDELLCLDPHLTQEALRVSEDVVAGDSGMHAEGIMLIRGEDLCATTCLGFALKSEADFRALLLSTGGSVGAAPLSSLVEIRAPASTGEGGGAKGPRSRVPRRPSECEEDGFVCVG